MPIADQIEKARSQGYSDQEIGEFLKKRKPELASSPEVTALFASKDEKPGPIERFASNVEGQANPVKVAAGLGNTILHPIDAIKGYLAQNENLANKATESFKNKHFLEGIRHGLNLAMNAIPGLGAQSDQAGDQINEGDVAGGMGRAVGAGLGQLELAKLPKAVQGAAETMSAIPDVISRGASAVKDVATSPGVTRSLDRAGNYAIAGGAVGLHPAPIALGVAAKVGAEALRRAGEKPAAPIPTIPPLYEELAQSQAKVSFSKLDAAGQAAIKQMADRIQNGFASDTTASTPSNGTTRGAPAADIPEAAPSPATEPVAAVKPESTLNGNRETVQNDITQSVAKPVRRFSRSMKVGEVADLLSDKAMDWEFTPDEIRNMNAKSWNKLAFDAGVPGGLSEPMMRRVVDGLRQKLAGKAGPQVEPEVLLDKLKKSLAERPKLTGKALDIAKALKEEMDRE